MHINQAVVDFELSNFSGALCYAKIQCSPLASHALFYHTSCTTLKLPLKLSIRPTEHSTYI